ncbi:DUF6109 family natural product biosynthesis protein [Vitiosangium sp. GDMCC 1.1324]|uniref:DUF6109 family natural product biosynthesis protein n=1 Tax=Vitiosangium sp. (strain GDMCC 1.1324) TaxID=2138576 RepID=UPI000D37071D|nr:DUF6109 family natural product biosynthesis protein [Vitiosangium sp. GDMCC 1.1324]PTL78973.1 hypothetical protein DAT35_35720 [Vitiosangium sp. GDMCC 1.1324]
MGRHDRTERQHRQWLEEARKYLERGNLEGMLSALLRLPPSQREELLPRSAALFRQSVQEQHRRGAWTTLGTLAMRADAEPRLVEQGAAPEEVRATYWPLVWAAGRARDWGLARRLWQSLTEQVRAHAPLLGTALDGWFSAEGSPAPEVIAPALERLPPVDSLLGVEPPGPRVSLPPPRSLAEVEGALLSLCALEHFPVFASRAEAWARAAPAEVARAVWELAGQLAARELWLRAAAGKGRASLVEPASLLARAVREGGAPEVLSVPTLQALRWVAAGLAQTVVSRADDAELLCTLAQAAALQPAVQPWVVQAVSGMHFEGAALPRALGLYQDLLARAANAPLWARAFLAWCEENPEAPNAPGWLQGGLSQLVATNASVLLSWLGGAAPSERTELVECVASTCAPDLVESWVEVCWEGADEELRSMLSEAILILLDRSRAKQGGRRLDKLLRGAQSLEDAARMVMEVEGAMDQVHSAMKLAADGLRIWRRFAPRVLTYRVEFLEEAVRHASSDAEAWDAAVRYLEVHPGDMGHLEALRTMAVFGRESLARRILARWLERLSAHVLALADAVVAAGRMGTPCEYFHPVLEAFMKALAEQSPAPHSATVEQARALAHEHGFRLRKRRSPRKKKAESTPARRAPRSKKKKGAAPPKEPESNPRETRSPEDGEGSR